jgi:ankyrin repeat protein
VKLLVQAGANVNITDSDNYTVLDNAIYKKQKLCGEFLRSLGAECKERDYPKIWKDYNKGICVFEPSALVDAVLARDKDRVDSLKQAGKHDIDVVDEEGHTTLQRELEKRNAESVRLLA